MYEVDYMLQISNKNNFTFKKINPYYLNRAKEEKALMNGCTGELLEDLMYDVFMKKIPTQDGIDTIRAIKPYANNIKPFVEPVEQAFVAKLKRDNKKINNNFNK